jgi:chromosome segregation ATPase
MNAILHEECEATVLTYEAIEVHLSYLRSGLEAVQADLPELRKEVKALDDKLSGKFEALDEKFTGKFEALDEKFTGKFEALDEKFTGKFETLDEKFTGKFETLADRLMKVQASQEGLKWFIGSLALISSGVSIAHSLGWV